MEGVDGHAFEGACSSELTLNFFYHQGWTPSQPMSSRAPDELQRELESVEVTGDAELLSELRAEARETVDAQRETLTDIDTKASRILRLNVLLIGIIVSVLSIAATGGSGTSPVAASAFVNGYTELGIGTLVLSTALAAMTYTASELDVGVSSENLATLLAADFSPAEIQSLLVKNYIVRINFNRSTNTRNIPLITATIALLVSGVVFFTLGTHEAVIGAVPWWLSGAGTLVIGTVVLVSGLHTQTVRAVNDIREWQ